MLYIVTKWTIGNIVIHSFAQAVLSKNNLSLVQQILVSHAVSFHIKNLLNDLFINDLWGRNLEIF